MTALSMLDDAAYRSCIPMKDEPGLGTLRSARGNLPLAAVDVQARITGLLAEVELTQTFRNPHSEPLEATYVFPLPDRAAVRSVRFEVAGRIVEAELKERGEARATYARALAQGQRAALAEEDRPGTFTLGVGNLMPGELATVRFVMVQPLPLVDGEVTFRFPLVVAPRYVPGTALGGEQAGQGQSPDTNLVPDASRISPPVLLPGFPNPVRLGLAVELMDAQLGLGQARSSLHTVTEQQSGGRTRFTVQPGERLDRDFILRFALPGDVVRSHLAVEADANGEGGTFALTLVPPTATTVGQTPRDVVFLLDHSGSMGGWKMVAARRAVARMVDALTDADRFIAFAFDDSMEAEPVLGHVLSPANDRNRFRVVSWLGQVEASGGTELAHPLSKAAQFLGNSAGRERQIVLVTDGQVGNEDHILKTLAPVLGDIRVFTVGIDTAVNEGFLRRLAAQGGGACELIEGEARLDEAMGRLFRRLGTPALTDLAITAQGGLQLDVASITPARLPDLHAGAPLVISGRYRGTAKGSLLATATDSAGMAFRIDLPAVAQPGRAIGALWARARLRDLEDRYAIDARAELTQEILATSLQHGVLCRFTAFVAVDREVVNAGGQRRQQLQPVELPQGWAAKEEVDSMSRGGGGSKGGPMAPPPPSMAHAPSRARAATGSAFGAVSPSPVAMESAADASDGFADDESEALMAPPSIGGMARSVASAGAAPGGLFEKAKKLLAKSAAPRPASASVPASPLKDASSAQNAPMAPPPPPAPAPSLAAAPMPAPARMVLHRENARRDEAPAEPQPGFEAYRTRAGSLRSRFVHGQGDENARRRSLGQLLVQLRMLVEDLRSIGAPAPALQPLADLLTRLSALLAAPQLAAWEADAEAVLKAFAEGGTAPSSTPAAPPAAGRSFWK